MKRIGFFALLMGVLMSFTNPTGYKVGDKATDFKLKSVDNKMYSMADYKDAKGFIVVFTCNHCPYAVKYEDRIIDLATRYKSKGYVLLAINSNDPAAQPEDSFELMQKRAKEKKFTFPYLFDEGQKIYPQYGATKTPHVFLLDKNLVVKYIGAIDDNVEDASQVKEKYLENAIAALEKGQEPTPNTTKAIGCSIKVKK
ncbi:thioredoxin family protein [Flavobacterium sp. HXWNR69]|uniref:Thioredoxin family protein n=1 Tax=Flavobacterium fragile TaxID=2949085 RepID=A0ABT0THG0_9FLAO|nr:thioredoxin family protein [Flavobacterium sp. HXWNR69]MCL9769845.1 thioredoxin family protein [Flavobacterium sp. HXWNR69]